LFFKMLSKGSHLKNNIQHETNIDKNKVLFT
jgi:hypothetical protein